MMNLSKYSVSSEEKITFLERRQLVTDEGPAPRQNVLIDYSNFM